MSDQRFKIRGGNHQIVAALADAVSDRITLGRRLETLDQQRNGRYVLSFGTDGGNCTAAADFVVLCLPFTILRDIAVSVPLPPIKKNAIQQIGYGTNAKLIVGLGGRGWRAQGFNGDSFVSHPSYAGWDSSRGQASPYAAYTIYPGGTQGLALGGGSAQSQAERLLPGLNRVFPGIQQQWLGTAVRANWPSNLFIRASYSAYRPGQWTSIRGVEGRSVGNLYFAGGHTSLDWQGYKNGGAESGRRVAQTLIGLLT